MKLGIKPEMKILLINQPDDYYSLLEINISNQLCRKNETPDFVHLNYALKNGLVDVKVCAVSDVWSGLKLVVPLAKR